MGASPDQLVREIEQTRAELRHTIQAIEHKLSPKRFARDNPWVIGGLLGSLAAVMVLMVRRARHGRD